MSNVIQFPKINPVITSRENIAATWIELFTNIGDGNEPTCAFMNVLYNLYKVGAPVTQATWKDLGFDLQWSPDGKSEFRIRTDLRPNLIPEFAVQAHTEFVSVVMEPVAAVPIDAAAVPNNLLQELAAYVTGQFPELRDAGLFSFMIHVLSKIVESPKVRYISHGIENGKFVALFFDEDTEKSSYIVTYTADNLPTLLDSEAMRMIFEKPSEEN